MSRYALPAACALLALPLLGATPPSKKAPPAPAGEPASVEGAKLSVLTDGKKHFLVVDGELSSDHVFWGDAAAVWQLRIGSGGGQKNDKGEWEQRSMTFWEPRFERGAESSIDLRDGKWAVTCGARTTELKPLSADESKAFLAAAKVYKARWTHRAYALSRDNTGKYFYVDRAREPEGNKNFRLFAGPKGNLKPLKMTNVVSDSQGDIFSTKSGDLRLVLNKNEYAWVQGGKPSKLLPVPVEDNHVMIYTDLGVYSGEKLGTPCDDL